MLMRIFFGEFLISYVAGYVNLQHSCNQPLLIIASSKETLL